MLKVAEHNFELPWQARATKHWIYALSLYHVPVLHNYKANSNSWNTMHITMWRNDTFELRVWVLLGNLFFIIRINLYHDFCQNFLDYMHLKSMMQSKFWLIEIRIYMYKCTTNTWKFNNNKTCYLYLKYCKCQKLDRNLKKNLFMHKGYSISS